MSQNPELKKLRYIAEKARNSKAGRGGSSSGRDESISRSCKAATNHNVKPGREFKYEWINVKKILLPKSDERLDEETVTAIAESIHLFGLLHPIAVRRGAQKEANGKPKAKIVLVAGAHRLEAMKRLGKTTVPCSFIDGNEAYAELVRLGENLWRKSQTVLSQAEALVKYFDLASSTRLNICGQLGQKSKRGRPPGGIALAARELPVVGRSVHARRKIIKRAITINRIEPEAKAAAIKAGLANNQKALLKIAEAGGQNSQLRTVGELAAISNKLNARLDTGKERPAKNAKGAAIQSPPLQPEAEELAAQTVTKYNEMVSLWKSKCRTSWAYLPFAERERFIEMLRRARRRARADVVELLGDVFRGREMIRKQDLFEFAATQGFAKGTIHKALKGLGYRSKRKGHGLEARWFFVNPERDWKGQLPVYSDADLQAARDTQPEPRQAPKGRKASSADYFSDVG
ncbi:ParB-like chromosome segregation protein Spo0J [Bradyrhizobium liaoningense]